MQAQVTYISADGFDGWDEFTEYTSDDPHDDWSSFAVNVGTEPNDPGELYYVNVATATAVGRLKQEHGHFKGLIVDQFVPDLVVQAIDNYVSQITAISWEEIRDHLQKVMTWEYEGLYRR